MHYDLDDEQEGSPGYGYHSPGAADVPQDTHILPEPEGYDVSIDAPDGQSEARVIHTVPDYSAVRQSPPPPPPHYHAMGNVPPHEYAQGQFYSVPGGAPGQPQGGPDWNFRRRGEVRVNEWREPSYSAPSDATSGMYTPGICANNPYARKRSPEAEQEREPRVRSGRAGRFVRAVCLILVCVLLSGAAAYGVIEYRFSRGDFDFDPVNQVVIGGSNANNPQGGVSTSISNTGAGISAQDIYDMALTQVVGIKTEFPGMGAFGGTSGSSIIGSGFIISTDGYILTNYHVIESAQVNTLLIEVVMSDGIEYEASIIGYDISNDVALLKIDATGLNPAIIANSDNIRVGQTVYAVGNPFGDLVYTMTDGIVSALDRIVTVERKTISTFQFSAAVNSGNSGGPIYDSNGEVIGIVTAKLMRGSVEGIGFAIPINDAIEVASGLIEHGYIAGRPFLGISAETVNSGHAEYFDWVVGVYVKGVNSDSAAEKAGLVIGDIITALDNTDIDSVESLRFALRRYRAGDTAMLTIWRAKESLELTITFDEDFSAGRPQRSQSEQEQPGRATPAP